VTTLSIDPKECESTETEPPLETCSEAQEERAEHLAYTYESRHKGKLIETQVPEKTRLGLVAFLTQRFRRVAQQLPLLPRAIGLVWDAAPRWTIAWIFLLVARGLLPVAIVYLTRSLVNEALGAMKAGGGLAAYRPALMDAVLMAGLLLAMQALTSLDTWVRTAQAELIRNRISRLVQEQSAAADLGFYDNPEFFDRLHRARAESNTVPLALMENLGGLAQNGITMVAMAGVLTMFGLLLPLILFASALPAIYVVLKYAQRQHQWFLRRTPDERRSDYFQFILTGRESAAELRLFGLRDYFRGRFDDVRGTLANEKIALARETGMAEFWAGAVSLAMSGVGLLWIAARAAKGQASAGDLALFYQAFQQGSGLSRTLLANLAQIYRNSLYLEGLFEFLELRPEVVSPKNPKPTPDVLHCGIQFRKVSFRYPGNERFALKDFSLNVPAGKILAIVGENGAGKSTLIKLLCRFYDPESGSVVMDGNDLRTLDVEELRKRIAVLFQEPAHYNATVAENIAPGNGTPREVVRAGALAAGADSIAAKLPTGYDHMLGRWFDDGADLSVGEWQRVALARAFVRSARTATPVLILDEPTSAMDPWAETDWLNRFRKLAEGRTAILITHRFTTARIADDIALMVGGRVIEQGTHEELVALGGKYASGWAAQTERSVV
jgi:ATP-binding cassette subfamily B protein